MYLTAGLGTFGERAKVTYAAAGANDNSFLFDHPPAYPAQCTTCVQKHARKIVRATQTSVVHIVRVHAATQKEKEETDSSAKLLFPMCSGSHVLLLYYCTLADESESSDRIACAES